MKSKGFISRSRLKMMMLVLVASAPAGAMAAQAEVDNFQDVFAEGTTDGYLRTAHYWNSNQQFKQAKGTSATGNTWQWGGGLNFTTASLYGFSGKLGADFQKTIHNHYTDPDGFGAFGNAQGDFQEDASRLAEAYVQYNQAIVGDQELTIRAGNQKLDDSIPFTGTYDYRIVPQIYQGVTAKYGTDQNNIQAIYNHRFQSRDAESYGREWQRFGQPFGSRFAAVGAQGGLNLDSVDLSGNAWYFDYDDLASLVYVDGQVKAASGDYKPFLGLQYANESETGDKVAGKIDGDLFGVQLGLDAGAWTATLNYAKIGGDTGLYTPYSTGASSSVIYAQPYLNSAQDFGPLDAYSVEVVAPFSVVPNTILGARYTILDQKSQAKANAALPNNGYFKKQNEALLFGIYNFQGSLQGLSVSNFVAYQTRKENDGGRDYVENRLTVNYNF